MREIGYTGYRREANGIVSRSLPPLRMTYASAGLADGFAPAPAATQENLPAGLGRRHAFVDLDGDGMPGILYESERSWFYKRNRGGGEFDAQTCVAERPATQPGSFGFGDVDRDGDLDLAQLQGRHAGMFEHDRDQDRWSGFRPFATLPHIEAMGGRVQWIDLNGDSRPDVVVAKGDRLVWFPSEGDGFGAPVDVPLPRSDDAAPTVGENPELDLFFADMNGDGVADLVRVRNGRVEYWPSLGNGRFGDAVVLDGAAQLAADEELDSGRIRFADIDGSGTADLLYLGRGEVRVWKNAAGNRLIEVPPLRGLPYLDKLAGASVIDLLGDGRTCLVWSSPLPGSAAPLQYLPLVPAHRPGLLTSVDNSLGRETRLVYSWSASHYLRDARAGTPWRTRLPSHVTVVDRLEEIDQIAGTRRVQRFEYHDGWFDGDEREFRGFGRVDVHDADASDPTDPENPDAGGAAFSPTCRRIVGPVP